MILSNPVTIELMASALGILPEEWRELAKQRFSQSLLWDPLPASAALADTFTADSDAWFIGLQAKATSRDVGTFAAQADRPFTVTMRASAGGRDFQSQAEDFDNVFGTAQLPAVWGAPLFIKPSSTINITLTNLVATDRLVRISISGLKVFTSSMGGEGDAV